MLLFYPQQLVIPDIVLYYCFMKFGILNELFASIQGEGPWVGERHIFVRFQGCDLHCCFCDTPASGSRVPGYEGPEFFMAQVSPGYSSLREQVANPVFPSRLTELCSRLSVHGPSQQTLSLTGGEPLLQGDFLAEWLPQVANVFRIFLETGGVHAEALKKIITSIDVVSMDFKLPSSTKMRSFWDEHDRFLDAASAAKLVVKAVVTHATSMDDVIVAARLIAAHDASIPFILQPAAGAWAPEVKALVEYQDAALSIIKDVRVIPQMHKILKVP